MIPPLNEVFGEGMVKCRIYRPILLNHTQYNMRISFAGSKMLLSGAFVEVLFDIMTEFWDNIV